jgi:hypothetical protein
MLVCVFLVQFAHETAGAARTRLSLRPLVFEEGQCIEQTSGVSRREIVDSHLRLNRRDCERSEAIHRTAKKEWIASLRSQ